MSSELRRRATADRSSGRLVVPSRRVGACGDARVTPIVVAGDQLPVPAEDGVRRHDVQTSASSARPWAFPLTARRRRWSQLSLTHRPPSCSQSADLLTTGTRWRLAGVR